MCGNYKEIDYDYVKAGYRNALYHEGPCRCNKYGECVKASK